MVNVVFVAPYFGASMVHCLEVLVALDDCRVGVITHEPEERVPPHLKGRLAGHYQVANTQDPDQLIVAAHAFQKEWGQVDRLLGYLEQQQVQLAQARTALGLPGMKADVAAGFRDKNRMKEILRRADLPVARQALVTKAEDARRFVDEVGYPVVLKPLAGLGTKDTMRVRSIEELYAALNVLLPSRGNPVQAEEFVSGAEHTFETISIRGEAVWSSSTYYLPGPLQVVENPWMQYCVLLPREQLRPHAEAFKPLNHAALKALGMDTGLTHMEWFRLQDGRAVISEVAARPPGVNIMMMNGLAHGVDFWAKWAELMVHERFEMPARKFACGCAFLRGQGRGRVVASVDGLDGVLAQLGDAVVMGTTPKVGQPRSSHYEGEGWLVVRAETTDAVVDMLRTIVTSTEIRYR
jgi:hypothetical protein